VAAAALVAYVWASYQEGVIRALATPLPVPLASFTTLHVPAAVAFLAAAVILTIQSLRTTGPIEIGLSWVLVAAWLGLDAARTVPVALLYLGVGGVALAAALVEALFAMAFLDPLTGLPSRRALDEALPAAGDRFSVAMIDVDHFKACNDTHGHDVGDQVLRMVAARLKQVSGGGKVYRYGGEEFAVVFPGLQAREALEHVEALRRAIADTPFTLRGVDRPAQKPEVPKVAKAARSPLKVTVSAGVAERHGGGSLADALRAADAALYRAKAAGRNRVVSG
jgi:diguanylate cyclase (GGDEF)-like protein